MFPSNRLASRLLPQALRLPFLRSVSYSDAAYVESFAGSLFAERPNCDIYDFRKPGTKSPFFVTCEHANAALPPGASWGDNDRARELWKTHWAYDPGSAELSLELAHGLGCMVGLSKWSRLYVDVNRPLASSTLMRKECEVGELVDLNTFASAEEAEVERNDRVMKHYLPYHMALGEAADTAQAELVISVHSYTKCYQGTERSVEVGVLSSTQDELAVKLTEGLIRNGYERTAWNQPWSGKDGFMYSADSVAFSGPGEWGKS